MIELEQISPSKMTERDAHWLQRGCEGAWDKATASDQVAAVNNGSAFLFRISGDMEGIIVLAIGNKRDRSILITALAGKGLFEHFPEFYQKVRELCKLVGAKTLYGFVNRPGLKLVYQRKTTARAAATLFVEDLT